MISFAERILARPIRVVLTVSALILALMPGIVMADEWVATQLRGRVFVQTDGVWVPLARGDIVSDTSPIQSNLSGRATFTRDNETITIEGATIIQIADSGTPGHNNTVVHQVMGKVLIEAEVQQVQHFSVETPFLAAVVKGTRFTVQMFDDGAEVSVDRGRVEVRDVATDVRVDVTPGHTASNVGGGPLSVDGRDTLASASGSGSGLAPGGGNGSDDEDLGGGGVTANLGGDGGVTANLGGGGVTANLGGGGGVTANIGGGGVNVNLGGGLHLGLGLGSH